MQAKPLMKWSARPLWNTPLLAFGICVAGATQAETKAPTAAKPVLTPIQEITSPIDDGRYPEAKTQIDAMLTHTLWPACCTRPRTDLHRRRPVSPWRGKPT